MNKRDQEELINEVLNNAVVDGFIKIGTLQRKLRISYKEAKQLVDTMEDKGMITPYDETRWTVTDENKQKDKTQKKILYLEQDDALAKIYAKRLEIEDFEVLRLFDVEDALVKTVTYKPDLIITDILLPKISGFDVIDIIKSTPETKHIPIIALTNLQAKEHEIKARDLGADDYLIKSQVPIVDVISAVRKQLGIKVDDEQHPEMIDISTIDTSFGGNNEPEDKHLSKLLGKAYRGEIKCRKAIIPMNIIKPFSDFKPAINEGYKKYFYKRYDENSPPLLFVYEKKGAYIMSDDYNAYYMYKEVEALQALCVVVGSAPDIDNVEYGPPFILEPPTVEMVD